MVCYDSDASLTYVSCTQAGQQQGWAAPSSLPVLQFAQLCCLLLFVKQAELRGVYSGRRWTLGVGCKIR